MPGVIVPRKTVGEVQRLIEDNEAEVKIELSQGKIRFTLGNVVLTSKLIDGTFPDYGRVIPQNNDKELIVDKKDFEAAVDRVSTISSERGRAVKLALSNGKLVLSPMTPYTVHHCNRWQSIKARVVENLSSGTATFRL